MDVKLTEKEIKLLVRLSLNNVKMPTDFNSGTRCIQIRLSPKQANLLTEIGKKLQRDYMKEKGA